jgi:hypothetical protein
MAIINFNSISGVSTISATSSITVGDKFISSAGVGLGQTTLAGRNAGVSTATGTIIFNSNNAKVQVYNGTEWVSIGDEQYIEATGGTISDYESGSYIYRAHIFTSSGTFSVTAAPAGASVEYLVVAGGGSGGQNNGGGAGGGGGGGFRTSVVGATSGGGASAEPDFPVSTSPGSYTVTIGAGAAAVNGSAGGQGTASVFNNGGPNPISSTGGGGGGNQSPASSGGSGGGGGEISPTAAGGAGTPGQGYSGGNGNFTGGNSGAGGGGAGQAGQNSTAPAVGSGGNGQSSIIAYGPSNPVTYAGGGGASGNGLAGSSGGAGGGGNGGAGSGGSGTVTSGTFATGGGGGGTYQTGAGTASGGSGIVVVRYQIGALAATAKATGGAISYYQW